MEEQRQSRGLSRRNFLRVSAGLAGVVTLTACLPPAAPGGSTEGGTVAEAGPTEIDVWTGWTEDAATNIEKILGGYNDSQSEVVAKHVQQRVPPNIDNDDRVCVGIPG